MLLFPKKHDRVTVSLLNAGTKGEVPRGVLPLSATKRNIADKENKWVLEKSALEVFLMR